MSIDVIAGQLAALPGAHLGRGAVPNDTAAPPTRRQVALTFPFDCHPQLASDPDYTEFYRRYGGARMEDPDNRFTLYIYGYATESVSFAELDYAVADADGYFTFAEWSSSTYDDSGLADSLERHFAFDLTGQRPLGVYEAHAGLHTGETEFTLRYPGFRAWLEHVVEARGLLSGLD